MNILHININYTGSALHQTMIEHLNNQSGIVNSVFVPTYDKTKSVVKCGDYVTVSECFIKQDRVFYFKKQRKIIKSILENYDMKKFDIIHAYTLFSDGNAAMKLSEKYGIPYVVAVRNTDVNSFFKKMIHLRRHGVQILKNASAVFFLSPAYRDTVINKYVPDKLRETILRKSYVIPNGIDDFWLENANKRNPESIINRIRNEKKLNCIYVGGIDKNKNVELTLKALSALNRKGWRCTLTSVGRIADKSVYEKLCSYSIFRYVAPKEKEGLIEYYRKSDIFVMPSHRETFGLVYAEAMSQGLPVIYTGGQGFDGQFDDGFVGWPVSDKEPAAMVSAIENVVNNYESCSENAYASANCFSWTSLCKKYVELYNCIKNGRQSALQSTEEEKCCFR